MPTKSDQADLAPAQPEPTATPAEAEEKFIVHTTGPLDTKTGRQNCKRCGFNVHNVDLGSIPKPGPFKTTLARPEAHAYAPNMNLLTVDGALNLMGEYEEGKALPSFAEYCKAETEAKATA